jgi:hypothetical protein
MAQAWLGLAEEQEAAGNEPVAQQQQQIQPDRDKTD